MSFSEPYSICIGCGTYIIDGDTDRCEHCADLLAREGI